MATPAIVLTDDTLSVIFDEEIYTIDNTHKKWDVMVKAVQEGEWLKLRELVGIPNSRWIILEL